MQGLYRLTMSLAAASCFVALGSLPNAAADDGYPPPTVPDDVAAAAQYRESVPTASGNVPSASVGSKSGTLASQVQAAIKARGGHDKKLLTSVGSSSTGEVARKQPHRQSVQPDPPQPSAARAALATLHLGSDLIALLVVLVGATVFAGVFVGRERPVR
jgi:hypothetical protein